MSEPALNTERSNHATPTEMKIELLEVIRLLMSLLCTVNRHQ